MYRFSPVLDGKLTPFVGIGAGIAIPHVEVKLKNGAPHTRQYQFAGGEHFKTHLWSPQIAIGLSYRFGT